MNEPKLPPGYHEQAEQLTTITKMIDDAVKALPLPRTYRDLVAAVSGGHPGLELRPLRGLPGVRGHKGECCLCRRPTLHGAVGAPNRPGETPVTAWACMKCAAKLAKRA